jgi:hypothetical protein
MLLIPVCGVFLFMFLYYIATLYYPGGNYEYPHSKGFSWQYNFWCHLLPEKAINGEINNSRPWAITAMLVLGLSVIVFIIFIPFKLQLSLITKRIIQWCGTISVFIFFLLLSSNHDAAINSASFFAGIALAGLMLGMYRSGRFLLVVLGMTSILLSLLNFAIYYSDTGMFYLPVIQKITFLVFLFWILITCIQLRSASSVQNIKSGY